MVAAVSSSGSLRRPGEDDRRALLASATAAAWPMPEPAPVTQATLPVNEAIDFSLHHAPVIPRRSRAYARL